MNKKLIISSSQLCVKEEFLSQIKVYLIDNRNIDLPDHVSNLNDSIILKKASEFYDTLEAIKNTVKSLKKQPLLLSAFFEGLDKTCTMFSKCVNIAGNYKEDEVNFVLNQVILNIR